MEKSKDKVRSGIRLTKSATFYKMVHNNQSLSNETIELIFSKILIESEAIDEPPYLWREINTIGVPDAYMTSGVIFRRNIPPTFLPEGDYLELKYGYLYIVEYDGYLIVSKRNVKGFENAINCIAYPVPSELLNRALTAKDAKIERMSAVNTDRTQYALKSKSLSANNLEEQTAPFENRSYALKSYRIKQLEGKSYSVVLSTSRAGENGGAVPIEAFVKFAMDFVQKLNIAVKPATQKAENGYLDSFSKPIEFSDRPQDLQPTKAWLDRDLLEDFLDENECDIVFEEKNGKTKLIEVEHFQEILGHPLVLSEVPKSGKHRITSRISEQFPIHFDRKMSVEIMATKVKLILPELRKYRIVWRNGSNKQTLEDFYNEPQNIILQFNDPQYTYLDGRLYQVPDLMEQVEGLLSVFHEYDSLAQCTSEKGKPQATDHEFAGDTLFRFVEEHLAPEMKCDYLACDDLGHETADFVGGNDELMCFFHCKSDSKRNNDDQPGLRNARFDSITGQVLNSLAELGMPKEKMAKKVESWRTNYRLNRVDSSISRIRKVPGKPENILKIHEKYLNNANARRRVYLVVNFLSKSELLAMVEKEKKHPGSQVHLIRFLWRVSSLITNCKGSRPIDLVIACLP